MKKNAIVVLNYEVFQETERCVDSILKMHLDVEGIVIVDNGSVNESYTYLKKKYRKNKNIVVIRSRKNHGFARGNNIGIKVAKKRWNVDFILLLNSDTVIIEEDYLDKIMQGYEPGIGVIQTSALRLNGRYSGKNTGYFSMTGILWEYLYLIADIYGLYFPAALKKPKSGMLNKWISGCDLVLTPDYFQKFRGLYPLTFLFGEEYILAILLKKCGLSWQLVENAHILHGEGLSTPPDLKEGTRKKHLRMLKAKRMEILVKLLPLSFLKRIINHGNWS